MCLFIRYARTFRLTSCFFGRRREDCKKQIAKKASCWFAARGEESNPRMNQSSVNHQSVVHWLPPNDRRRWSSCSSNLFDWFLLVPTGSKRSSAVSSAAAAPSAVSDFTTRSLQNSEAISTTFQSLFYYLSMGNSSSSSKPSNNSKMSAESENFIKSETLKHQVGPSCSILYWRVYSMWFLWCFNDPHCTDHGPIFLFSIRRLSFLARHIAVTARQSRRSLRNRNLQVSPWRFMNWITCPMEIVFKAPWQAWRVKELSPVCGSRAITLAAVMIPKRRSDQVVCSVC